MAADAAVKALQAQGIQAQMAKVRPTIVRHFGLRDYWGNAIRSFNTFIVPSRCQKKRIGNSDLSIDQYRDDFSRVSRVFVGEPLKVCECYPHEEYLG